MVSKRYHFCKIEHDMYRFAAFIKLWRFDKIVCGFDNLLFYNHLQHYFGIAVFWHNNCGNFHVSGAVAKSNKIAILPTNSNRKIRASALPVRYKI